MAKIRYATCPHCGAVTALDEKDVDAERVVCFGCCAEFSFDKELLKSIDEIVEEGEAQAAPRKS